VTMFPEDDPRFRFEDDPHPPEPDTAVLQRVVARGRQRMFRRRALFGGGAVAIVAVVLSGGVAVAQHRSAGPGVQIQSQSGIAVDETTTTVTLPQLTTTTPTGNAGASQPLVSTPTTACLSCPPVVPAPAGTQAATPADFTGEVKLTATQVAAGDDIGVERDVYNATNHPVDVEGMMGDPAAAVVCANDLTPDGHTNAPLHNDNPDANIFWIVAPVTNPGAFAGIGPMTVQTTAAEVGVVTCEAVLVGTHNDGNTMTSYIIARLDNIAAVTYTVLPAPDSTSTTTSTTDTSTTTPATTVPPH
jgi:hypothetical protein